VATKLQNISELARQTTERLTQSVDNWKRFLDSAAWLYKYPFHEQVLIHAQRPDAKACAPIELWNSRFRRWVNRDAKGIALIDDSGHKPALRYVFDVSDTNTRYNIPFRLWQTRPEYEAQIIEELENHFGETGTDNTDLAAIVLGISINAISDNYRDYYEELLKAADNSALADMSDDEISSTFMLQLMTSVSHTVLVRLGIDPAAIFHGDEYESIRLFNSPDTIAQLGAATSDISEMVLRQIERSVRSMERQERDALAKSQQVLQNEDRKNERSVEHGTQLQAERGLPDSRYRDGRAADGGNRQIRDDEEGVSQSPSEWNVQRTLASEQADRASAGDRQDGAGAGRTDDGADGESRGRDGEDESRESDALDSANEQHSAESRGDGTERPDLRITEYSLFPTLEEQLQRIEEAEAQKLSAFSVSQADLDNELCRHGSGFAQGKIRIYKFFEDMPSSDAAITFLKKEYGIGGHSHTYLNGESGFVDHDGKGIHFSNHNYKEKHTITWKVVARRLRELIALDRYLTEKEKAHLPEYEAQEAERRLQLAEEAAAREALRAAAAAMDERRKDAQYSFSLGDTVQLGATTYTILGYDEHSVMLSDPKYPLLSEDMERDVFERRLRENPANDHLIIETEPAASNEETESTTEIVTETVEVISAEENHLPYDVVIQTIRTEEREPAKPAEKTNFRITDDALGHGGPKAKFRMNMDAIRTLQTIEFEQRLATPEEQEVLSRYVGWGSLPQVFEESNAAWADEFQKLYETLSPEEYEAARASVLNAHYTSPTVIKAMYAAIEKMGFRMGNILEPSCGIGNFFGLLPESMAGSKLYGIELDGITGRIAKQLYQNANITIQGYEETALPDSFFDVAIGNVPFGDYGVTDKRYDKNHFLIHDYFIAKTLDKVRPGGIIAFVTSSGTMDKKNPSVRKYIAQRADLLGAVRLPNNAFLANAGTGVVADILFLQKRDRPIEIEPDWVHLGKTDGKFIINQYFVNNPGMILGELSEENTQYGKQAVTVKPIAGAELPEQLSDAIANIHAKITEPEQFKEAEENIGESIPADPNVRNFSFTVVDGDIYYRENSLMHKVELSVTAESRIKGMVKIRDCTRKLIEYQLEGYSDNLIRQEQQTLNRLYDEFTAQYGLLNSRANNTAFSDDSSYCLLCSLEVLDENGALVRKADMFSKRTIRQQEAITSCDTATDALALSLSEKAMIDMDYMAELTGKNEETLFSELKGVIFLNPLYGYGNNSERKYLTADEYLSGNVREKLAWARKSAEQNPDDYLVNVEALEKVQPIDLSASEIDVRLGATWLPQEDIQRFMVELLKPAYYASSKIKVHYSPLTAEWNISNKNSDYGNVTANVTYGTKRINGYKIIEETLNLKDVRIFDTVQDENGNDKRVLNKKETVLAQQKQQLIKDAFRDWIWKDPARRERLTTLYNERFNSVRPREYDGSHIKFVGMNPEITLREHQVNAIARILYGGNTLLAHVVGAGKTFEMVAAAMESKRLGFCQKSLFVVPNHLTEQWAAEFLQLYPSANILVATKKDFETRNRKKFCSRIATGDYDAVIIGHSQFEKIPMSVERQRAILQAQLDEIIEGISEAKRANAERFTIKQIEKSKRSIKLKLDKLNDQTRKDDVVTFEELGVDRLFVDEAHSFKNLFLYTKMRNVAGLAQTEAQKSSDLFMKCRYMDELTDNRGIVFATGTPISNSMTEMYTMQRYLQYDALCSHGLQHFDAWASTFGETITAIELAPEGTGYRAKTRFARFYNLPELISMFKQVADVQTADMLKLPIPEAEYHNEVIKPSKFQTDMVASFSERAEKVRNGMVDATVDNMLKITNDGRKLALDQRLTDDLLPDDPESKVNLCLDNIHRIWESSSEQKSTQLVFCDLSTPHGNGKFNVYDDLKAKLIRMGVPETEIAFIHDAKTEAQKAALFTNVRAGNVRILLGSTAKMGAGTNVQKRLIAEHHLDIPWRPSDIEQREGRILRQGNENKRVDIFRYVTENTFDSYMWQTIENKQKFISQIMTSKSPVRSCEDVDETALSYAEIKALATGNPYIREKMDLEIEVSRLKLVKANYLSQKYMLEDSLLKHYPKEIRLTQERIKGYAMDIALYERHKSENFPGMLLYGTHYAEKKEAGTAILEACKAMTSPEPKEVGGYREFTLLLSYDIVAKVFRMTLRGELSHTVELGSDIHGNIQRMENVLESLPSRLSACEKALATLKEQMDNAKAEVKKPFEQEHELSEKAARLAELDALLNMDKRENAALDAEPEHTEIEPIKTSCKER
jgi:N12 class adenine-specific DNA methylase